jgi:aspartate-semialdehyde dehydrogenase
VKKKIKLAIVGATGLIGETLLALLAERDLPVELFLLASDNSAGRTLDFGETALMVQDVALFDFTEVDYAIFSAGKSVSETYVPKAIAQHCTVIDNSSAFRYDDDVLLIVPEVNGHLLEKIKRPAIIANPNCSTIQMVMALKPLADKVGIKRVNVSTYQAVSGAGQEALRGFVQETSHLLNMQSYQQKHFPKQMAFNVIPHIDTFEDNGYTREEMKMVWESKKILNDPELKINPTAVRVPVFYGHAMALHIELEKSIGVTAARKLLSKMPGIKVMDRRGAGGYPTPVGDGSGQDNVLIGRIRQDLSCECGLNMWVVADNIRKGGALNALQILELLV